MKKVTFLTCVLALCTSTMFAQTLEVTTADMDPVAAGGLVYVIDHAESGRVSSSLISMEKCWITVKEPVLPSKERS